MTPGHLTPRTIPISVIASRPLYRLRIFYCLSFRLCHNKMLHKHINMPFFKTCDRFPFRIIREIFELLWKVYCFIHSGIFISLPQQNFKIRKCSREVNSVQVQAMTHVFTLSTLLSSMRRAKFLLRPILFESGLNWNLKFWFLGQYG